MKREAISLALNGLEDTFISEAAEFCPEGIQETPERIVRMKTKRIISIALAAALILAFGIVAYATDIFGLRAMQIKDSNLDSTVSKDGGIVSITQPQDVPDEMNPRIQKKIENSTKAWNEWENWRKENGIHEPDAFVEPEGCEGYDLAANKDGTYTITFYSDIDPVLDDNYEVIDWNGTVIETRTISAEEYAEYETFYSAINFGFSNYDFKYNVYSQEMADKLEEIAARYGLQLRHQATLLSQTQGENAEDARDALTEKINGICAGGKSLFHSEPFGYDKFYYHNEGTFAISFYTTADQSNNGTRCYLYNSPYGTLSSGFEIVGEIEDVNTIASRIHTTPDGVDVTVLHGGSDMYAYVYLDDSFVTLHITQPKGLTDAEIDSIIDMIDFSVIG